MKENQFEVIVPAYDALESELEDILGGGCIWQCSPKCKPNTGGGSGNCTEAGNIPTNQKPCCQGLIAVVLDKKTVCLPQA